MSSDWSSLFCLNVGWRKIPASSGFKPRNTTCASCGVWASSGRIWLKLCENRRIKESNEEVKLWMTGGLSQKAASTESGHGTSVHHTACNSPWASHKLEVTRLEDEQESYLCLRWCHLPGRVMRVDANIKAFLDTS